jgi:cell division protein ZapA
MQKSIRISIAGRDYSLRVREENEVLTRELAHYVDAKLRAFKDAHPEQSDSTAAVISAMAIAEELFMARSGSEDRGESIALALDELERELATALLSKA